MTLIDRPTPSSRVTTRWLTARLRRAYATLGAPKQWNWLGLARFPVWILAEPSRAERAQIAARSTFMKTKLERSQARSSIPGRRLRFPRVAQEPARCGAASRAATTMMMMVMMMKNAAWKPQISPSWMQVCIPARSRFSRYRSLKSSWQLADLNTNSALNTISQRLATQMRPSEPEPRIRCIRRRNKFFLTHALALNLIDGRRAVRAARPARAAWGAGRRIDLSCSLPAAGCIVIASRFALSCVANWRIEHAASSSRQGAPAARPLQVSYANCWLFMAQIEPEKRLFIRRCYCFDRAGNPALD